METEKETETENPKKNIDKNSVHNKDTDYHTYDVNTDVSIPPTLHGNEIQTNTVRNKYTFYI